MKNKNNISLISIKLNKEIAHILHHSHKITTNEFSLWLKKHNDKQTIFYALLVSKNVFKLAVTRNKIKRMLRCALQNSFLSGGISLLVRPKENFHILSFVTQLDKIKTTTNCDQYANV